MSSEVDRPVVLVSRLIDLLGVVCWLVFAVVLFSVPASVFFGLGVVGIKFGLMIGGFLTVGYALLLLKPERPGVYEDGQTEERERDRPLEGVIGRVPPWRWYPVPPGERVPLGIRIAVAGIAMLVTSYAMEAIAGIRA